MKFSTALKEAVKLAERNGTGYITVPRKRWAAAAERPTPDRLIATLISTPAGIELSMSRTDPNLVDAALTLLEGH